MATTYRFAASPEACSEILEWFRALAAPPAVTLTDWGAALHFKDFGEIKYRSDGSIDADASPLATVLLPKVRRDVIWTIGEVRFLTTPLRRLYPGLHGISTQFAKWIEGFDCVFANDAKRGSIDGFNYYLEGSLRNYLEPIWALPSGFEALQNERYFVSVQDNEIKVDTLCRSLRLRGVECSAT
jgi:hypothetical protein